jgi:DNA-binding XRE family transcriptional regulator
VGAQPVMVRLLPTQAAAVDNWKDSQADRPGRPEAIRRLIDVALLGPNASIPKVSIRQIKAARALLGWSQEELAAAAEVSIPTIKRLEAHDGALGGRHETGNKIRLALETAGVEFIDENGGGPGVRLRKRQKK